jgi:hypothetical protein
MLAGMTCPISQSKIGLQKKDKSEKILKYPNRLSAKGFTTWKFLYLKDNG